MIGLGVFTVVAGFYGWYMHGVLIGLIAAVAMFVVTVIIYSVYLKETMGGSIYRNLSFNRSDGDQAKMFRHFEVYKWILFLIIMIILTITSPVLAL